jgi:hypothetical protein
MGDMATGDFNAGSITLGMVIGAGFPDSMACKVPESLPGLLVSEIVGIETALE